MLAARTTACPSSKRRCRAGRPPVESSWPSSASKPAPRSWSSRAVSVVRDSPVLVRSAFRVVARSLRTSCSSSPAVVGIPLLPDFCPLTIHKPEIDWTYGCNTSRGGLGRKLARLVDRAVTLALPAPVELGLGVHRDRPAPLGPRAGPARAADAVLRAVARR